MHLAKLAAAALLVSMTAVLGLAARSRPAAPYGRALRSLRQSGGENTRHQRQAITSRRLNAITYIPIHT
jgi:hypothetical protein